MTSRNIKLLSWHGFLTEFKLYAPVAVLYFQGVTGSFTAATSVIAAGVIASTCFEVPTGMLSDRIGRKGTMTLSAFVFVLYVLLMALAKGPALLFGAAIMAGLSDALASGNNNALLYELLSADGRQRNFKAALGRINARGQAAMGISAVAGGVLLALGGNLNSLVWISLVPQILRTGLCFFIVEPPRAAGEPPANIFHDLRAAFSLFRQRPRLRLLTVAGALQNGVGEAAHRFGPAFTATLWPLWAISAFSVLRNLMGMAGYGLAGRIINRFGEGRVMMASAALMTCCGVLAALMQNIISPLLLYTNSLFYGPAAVAREHLMQQEFSDRQRATMGSLSEFCSSLVTGIAALGLGAIADTHGPAIAFLCAMIVRLPVIFLYRRLFRT